MGKRKNKKAIVTPVNVTITLADLEEYAKLCPKGKTTHKTDADVTISAQSQKRICVSILREPRKGLFSTEEYWRLIWACDKKRITLCLQI